MNNEPYTLIGPDENNPASHVIIELPNRKDAENKPRRFSVVLGTEQDTANEVAFNSGS